MSRTSKDEYESYKLRRRSAGRGPLFGARDFDRLLRQHDLLRLKEVERGLGREEAERLTELIALLLFDPASEVEEDDSDAAREVLAPGIDAEVDAEVDIVDIDVDLDVDFDADIDATTQPDADFEVLPDFDAASERDLRSCQQGRGSFPCSDHCDATVSRLGSPIPSSESRRERWRFERRNSRT